MRVPAATAAPSVSQPYEAHVIVHVDDLTCPCAWLLWKRSVRNICRDARVTSFEMQSEHVEGGKVVVSAKEGRSIPHLDIISHVRILLDMLNE